MTITLVEANIEQQLKAVEAHSLGSSASANHYVSLQDPQHLSKGYRHWLCLRPGLRLLIQDYQLHDQLVVETVDSNPKAEFEFGFNLLGDRQDHYLGPGCNFLALNVETEDDTTFQAQWPANQRVLKVDIHGEPTTLETLIGGRLETLPSAVPAFMKGIQATDYYQAGAITPAMRLSLQQILNCPYQGLTQQLYLESKCLELIALRLEQVRAEQPKPSRARVLRGDDLERIHQARDILLKHLCNPPSLFELAQQVGLNDYKLKLGFRQVFGTTTFGYLHTYRMESARQLLEQESMTIKEVAQAVGYAHPRYFAAAFKQQFGASPRTYRSVIFTP